MLNAPPHPLHPYLLFLSHFSSQMILLMLIVLLSNIIFAGLKSHNCKHNNNNNNNNDQYSLHFCCITLASCTHLNIHLSICIYQDIGYVVLNLRMIFPKIWIIVWLHYHFYNTIKMNMSHWKRTIMVIWIETYCQIHSC